MVKKFLTILKKDFNILLNSKLSSLIFILGPILLMLLIGVAFSDTSIKNINFGVYSSSDDSFSKSFIEELHQNSFNTQEFNSLENCKNSVVEGDNHACINIKKTSLDSFDGELDTGNNYDLDLYVDFSQQRLVWNIIGTIQRISEDRSRTMREQEVENLKHNADKLIEEINKQQNYINSAISQIDDAQNTLSQINSQQINSENSIANIKNELDKVENSLNILNDLSLLDTYYKNQIAVALSSIEIIQFNLNNLENSVDNYNLINQVQYYLRDSKQSLFDLKISLEEIDADLNEIKSSDLERLANPIKVNYASVRGEGVGTSKGQLEFVDYIFPNFLIFFILFSSIIYSSMSIIRERKSKAYIRNISSKVSKFNLIFSNFLTSVFIILLQIVAILLVSNYFLNIYIFPVFLNLILFLLISISIFSLVGILIGVSFNSQESSIVASISVSLLFFMFSSLISPIETLPRIASKIVSFTPLPILETKLRLLLIFNSKLSFSFIQGISLISLGILLILLISLFYRRNKEKEI